MQEYTTYLYILGGNYVTPLTFVWLWLKRGTSDIYCDVPFILDMISRNLIYDYDMINVNLVLELL